MNTNSGTMNQESSANNMDHVFDVNDSEFVIEELQRLLNRAHDKINELKLIRNQQRAEIIALRSALREIRDTI